MMYAKLSRCEHTSNITAMCDMHVCNSSSQRTSFASIAIASAKCKPFGCYRASRLDHGSPQLPKHSNQSLNEQGSRRREKIRCKIECMHQNRQPTHERLSPLFFNSMCTYRRGYHRAFPMAGPCNVLKIRLAKENNHRSF